MPNWGHYSGECHGAPDCPFCVKEQEHAKTETDKLVAKVKRLQAKVRLLKQGTATLGKAVDKLDQRADAAEQLCLALHDNAAVQEWPDYEMPVDWREQIAAIRKRQR